MEPVRPRSPPLRSWVLACTLGAPCHPQDEGEGSPGVPQSLPKAGAVYPSDGGQSCVPIVWPRVSCPSPPPRSLGSARLLAAQPGTAVHLPAWRGPAAWEQVGEETINSSVHSFFPCTLVPRPCSASRKNNWLIFSLFEGEKCREKEERCLI